MSEKRDTGKRKVAMVRTPLGHQLVPEDELEAETRLACPTTGRLLSAATRLVGEVDDRG